MRALVTGGAGFIGSHVADALLARGDEVHVVDSLATGSRANVPAGAELHEVDIRDAALGELTARVRPEVVFHLAAQADVAHLGRAPRLRRGRERRRHVRLLEATRKVGASVVFTSTGGAMYGECEAPRRRAALP